jgi:hypothetical protein
MIHLFPPLNIKTILTLFRPKYHCVFLKVTISFPVTEIHRNAKSRGVGGPAEKGLGLPARSPACRSLVRRAGASAKAGRHRLKIDLRRSKTNKNLIFIDHESFP